MENLSDSKDLIQVKPLTPAEQKSLVLKEASTNEVFMYPAALGVVGLGGVFLLDVYLVLFIILAVGGIGVGGGKWLLDYFVKRHAIIQGYYHQRRVALEKETAAKLKGLKNALVGLEQERAAKQVDYLTSGMDRLKEKLIKKFGKDSSEYDQFMMEAQRTYLAALYNLNLIVSSLKDVRSMICVKDSEDRIAELKRERDRDNLEEIALQQSQIDKYHAVEERAKELVTKVEACITALIETTTSLETFRTTRKEMEIDARKSIERLTNVADNTRDLYTRLEKNWSSYKA